MVSKDVRLQDVLPAWLVTREGEPVSYGDRVRPRKIGWWARASNYGSLSRGIYGDVFKDECSNKVIKDSISDGELFDLLWYSGDEYIFIAGERIKKNGETRKNADVAVVAEENVWVSFQYLSEENIMVPAGPKKRIRYDDRRAYIFYFPGDHHLDFPLSFMWHIKNDQQINRKLQPAVYYLTQAIALKKYVVEQCDFIIPGTPEGDFLMEETENLFEQYLSFTRKAAQEMDDAIREKQDEIRKSLAARDARAERLGYHTATSDEEVLDPNNREPEHITGPMYVLGCEEEEAVQHGEGNDGEGNVSSNAPVLAHG